MRQSSRCVVDRQTAAVLLLWIALLAGCGAVVGQTSSAVPAPPPAGDPQRGATLFAGEVAITGFVACRGCHATDPLVGDGIGPNLAGVAMRAGSRVPGIVAEEYLRRSIRIHDEYVVPGFEAGIARAVVGRDFGDILTDEQIADLVAYLLTLDRPAAREATPVMPATAAAAPVAGASPVATVNGTASPAPSGELASPSTIATAAATDVPVSPAAATAPGSSPTSAVLSSGTAMVAPSATREDQGAIVADPIAPMVQPIPTATPAPAEATAPRAVPEATATLAPAEATAPPAVPEATATAAPTATPVPAPATPAPPALAPVLPTAPATSAPPANGGAIPADLAVFVPCMTCHDQHPASVVKMPHVVFPPCISCHSGSPIRLGCPTCHSTHRVQVPHADDDPNIPCTSCHPDK